MQHIIATVSGQPARLQRCHAVLMKYGKGDYNNVGHSCFELKAWGRSGQGGGGVDTVGVGEVPGGGDGD